jgi:hypothetical protein
VYLCITRQGTLLTLHNLPRPPRQPSTRLGRRQCPLCARERRRETSGGVSPRPARKATTVALLTRRATVDNVPCAREPASCLESEVSTMSLARARGDTRRWKECHHPPPRRAKTGDTPPSQACHHCPLIAACYQFVVEAGVADTRATRRWQSLISIPFFWSVPSHSTQLPLTT